jgi:hypothetical protein
VTNTILRHRERLSTGDTIRFFAALSERIIAAMGDLRQKEEVA